MMIVSCHRVWSFTLHNDNHEKVDVEIGGGISAVHNLEMNLGHDYLNS